MEEGRTFFGDEAEDAESVRYPFGVGRGFYNKTLGSRTPGFSDTVLDTPHPTSTRFVQHTMPSQVEQSPDIGSLISHLAEKLGESISAQLHSDRDTFTTKAQLQPSEMTQPNVNVVLQSDAREPPIFRGDSSDKFTVHEWQNLMTLYLRKKAIPVHEQSQEILARLMGKAGDMVRIKMRNNSSIDYAANPSLLFDILSNTSVS